MAAVYSSLPIPVHDGLVYQTISHGHYTLRFRREQVVRNFEIEGNAFDPVLLPSRDMIRFESVRSKTIHQFLLNPETGFIRPSPIHDVSDSSESRQSPDGRWMVCERTSVGSTQIVLLDRLQKRKPISVTEGRCNSFAPAWERDSRAIVFASDCGRGVGMPALYRAPLEEILALAFQLA